MSLNEVRAGNTRHPLYPLFLGIFGIICVIAGIVFAAEFRAPAPALADEEDTSVTAQLAVQVPSNLGDNPFREVVRLVKPAVVNITTERAIGSGGPNGMFDDQFFNFGPPQPKASPFGEEQETTPSGGSGFIVDKDGYIVTNNHVIADAVRIQVNLDDGRVFDAEVIGTDPATDVAVIKVKDLEGPLPYLQFGDSDNSEIGDWVIAVGSPLGLEQTVTVGVVSAKNRNQVNIPGSAYKYSDFIQTDAAINFGNSGGPLLTIDGKIVGMNTAIAGGPNVSGIGFAVPANKIKFVYKNLITDGVVRRGYIGILVKDLTPTLAKANGMDIAKGAIVTKVEPNTPASRAGLEFSDIILKVNGTEVNNKQHLVNLVAEEGVGVPVDLEVLRNESRINLTLKTEQRPDEVDAAVPVTLEDASPQSSGKASLTLQNLGLVVSTLETDMAKRLELPAGITGVLVEAVKLHSEPYREGIDEGDVITHVNSTAVSDVEGFRTALEKARDDSGYARITVKRRLGEDWVSMPFALSVPQE